MYSCLSIGKYVCVDRKTKSIEIVISIPFSTFYIFSIDSYIWSKEGWFQTYFFMMQILLGSFPVFLTCQCSCLFFTALRILVRMEMAGIQNICYLKLKWKTLERVHRYIFLFDVDNVDELISYEILFWVDHASFCFDNSPFCIRDNFKCNYYSKKFWVYFRHIIEHIVGCPK